ncbi:MAG: hypothetical protein C0410_02560 [Anaerolinea sp.]|nr:hypothetical protein [Anaerolinea sp.]
MGEFENYGVDLGMGGTKVVGPTKKIQLISQVSVKSGQLVGRMSGLSINQVPLEITLTTGNSFYVDSNAHDYGRCVENMGMERIASGSPDTLALFYGALTRMIQQTGEMNDPISVTCGLPIETLSGDKTRGTIESIQKWVKGEHAWKGDDKEYRVCIAEVKVTSQPAGALFDYTLDQAGGTIPSHSISLNKELGIISIGMNTLELLTVREKTPIQKFTRGSTSGVRRLLEMVNDQSLYSLGELDSLLRSKKLDVSRVLPIWEREIIGEIEKCWGKSWRRFESIILVGGGVLLLHNTLPSYFEGRAYIPDDPIFSIARGLWKLHLYQSIHKKG